MGFGVLGCFRDYVMHLDPNYSFLCGYPRYDDDDLGFD